MQWARRSPRHSTAGRGDVETPESLPALRQIGLDRPVLEELRAVVEDLAEPAFVDELLGERDRGDAAVVVPDHVRHTGLLDGRDHLAPLDRVHRQRLLAEDRLLVRRGRERDLPVQVVRSADVDHVDVRPLDQLPPVGLGRLVAPLVGELLDLGGVAGARGLQHDLVFRREELADLLVGVRVGAAHEAVADHADAKLLLGHGRVSVESRPRRGEG